MKRVIAAAREPGIDPADIRIFVRVEIAHDDKGAAASVAHYPASKGIQILLKDVSRVDAIDKRESRQA